MCLVGRRSCQVIEKLENSWLTSWVGRVQVVGSMVSEIILCVKEVNQKTRTAAYELLVSLAKAMHEQHPPPPPALGQDMDMGGSSRCSSPVIASVQLCVRWLRP